MLIRSFAAARLVFAAFAILAFPAAVHAATYATYVASNGDDSRPCTVVTAPCKTLQRAFNVTSANGIVRVLTQVTGGVVINKSITITGDGATVIGQIVIASPSAVVTLRGLALNGVRAIAHGVRIDSAAAVQIENCTVERYTSDGISVIATSPTELLISDTVVRANVSDGLYTEDTNAKVVIQNSHFDQNGASGVYLKVARASVTGSSASGNNTHGIILLVGFAKITETAADNNSGDGFSLRQGVTALNSAEAIGNGTSGLHMEAIAPTIAVITSCVFIGTFNSPGVENEAGLLTTLKNNTVVGPTGADPEPWIAY